jgi:hypothetical protein
MWHLICNCCQALFERYFPHHVRTFCFRQATHAVTFRVISGGLRSPKCSRSASTDVLAEADGDMVGKLAPSFLDYAFVKLGYLLDRPVNTQCKMA